MRIVVVMVSILVATTFMSALSPQLAYSRAATTISIPPEIACKMEPTSSECVQPLPSALPIRANSSLSSPLSTPPEILCKMNPNSAVCIQLSQPLVSLPPPSQSITAKQVPSSITAKLSTANTPSKRVTVENNFTTNLKIGNKIYPINYQITGTGNKIISVILEKDKSALLANISSPSSGTLTIQLPRNIIDAKKQGTNLDESYAVLVNSKYAVFHQIKNDTTVRTLAIDLGGGSTNIEIVGTHAVPEFGTAAFTALLSIAIAGIVITTRAKFGPKIKLKQK